VQPDGQRLQDRIDRVVKIVVKAAAAMRRALAFTTILTTARDALTQLAAAGTAGRPPQ
jgi:hypothetical protein